VEWLGEHSLTLFLLVTGIAWVVAFKAMDPNRQWGQVVGNIVSEWTQILGLVLMTKRLMEVGSKARCGVPLIPCLRYFQLMVQIDSST
jgi:hypothetical protein